MTYTATITAVEPMGPTAAERLPTYANARIAGRAFGMRWRVHWRLTDDDTGAALIEDRFYVTDSADERAIRQELTRVARQFIGRVRRRTFVEDVVGMTVTIGGDDATGRESPADEGDDGTREVGAGGRPPGRPGRRGD